MIRDIIGYTLYAVMFVLLTANIFLFGHDRGFTLGYHIGYGDRDLGYPEGYSLDTHER